MNSTPSEKDKKIVKVVPFKLCFVAKKEPGRSNIQIGKPLNYVPVLTPKFYTLKESDYKNIDEKILMLVSKQPKEKYTSPVTQNQKYGWYEANFQKDLVLNQLLNFRKAEKQFIKEHLMTYEKIRD